MKIPNINNQPLEVILPKVQQHYPSTEIKKQFLSPKHLRVPYDNFHFIVINKKSDFIVRVQPPVLWNIMGIILGLVLFSIIITLIMGRLYISVGGAIPILIGVLITTAIFKSRNKEKIDTFTKNFREAIQVGVV